MYVLSAEKKLAVLSALVEGNSIRSTERMTGVHRDTIMRLLVSVGTRCMEVLDNKMRDLTPRYVQCDEIWTFVAKKKAATRKTDSPEIGDQWVFVAMDADSKAIICHLVGKRSSQSTWGFVEDLQHRIAARTQVTTDGFAFYRKAVENAFGSDVDFAQLVKLFDDPPEHRYSPGPIVETISKVISGNPDPAHISTSYVERQNLTMRMQIRRLTRLTNAFSKKLENLKAACALHFAYYNFCRIHKSLRVTPAMAAGVSDHVWNITELLAA